MVQAYVFFLRISKKRKYNFDGTHPSKINLNLMMKTHGPETSSLNLITLSGMGVLGAFPKSKIELLSGHFGLDSVCYSNKMDIQFCP